MWSAARSHPSKHGLRTHRELRSVGHPMWITLQDKGHGTGQWPKLAHSLPLQPVSWESGGREWVISWHVNIVWHLKCPRPHFPGTCLLPRPWRSWGAVSSRPVSTGLSAAWPLPESARACGGCSGFSAVPSGASCDNTWWSVTFQVPLNLNWHISHKVYNPRQGRRSHSSWMQRKVQPYQLKDQFI